jgi:hypothetical protein
MNVGTKSVLLDCELLLFTFQFRTFIPTGSPSTGTGTGHVSLEPSFLWALKLTQTTYFQGQLAYLTPIGGTHGVQSDMLWADLSLNQLLWQCGACNGVQLIGSAELSAYEFGGGGYTDPGTGLLLSARGVDDIVNIGPGLRLVVCNKIDFGVGSAFAVTRDRLAGSLIRAEFRWRF